MSNYAKEKLKKYQSERIGQKKYNKQGYLMNVVEYNNCKDVIVEFDDDCKTKIKCRWSQFANGTLVNPIAYENRVGEENLNYQNCLMKIIEYNKSNDIVVEFQDKYKTKINAAYREFKNGSIRNPYHPVIFNVGITGNKYPTRINGSSQSKEYNTWKQMIRRCFSEEYKKEHSTYENAICCEEWLLYENFYEWLHSQENFDKWRDNYDWHLDKDIIIKGNKIYSPETCCLVPQNVNKLFIKNDINRGNYPIGVSKTEYGYGSYCNNTDKQEFLGYYGTKERAFLAYKKRKEYLIKQAAKIEYENGNITKECYEAMLNYIVEIDD